MARGRNETNLLTDPMICRDEIDEPGIPDRSHRVGDDGSHVLPLLLACPMRIFDTAHQISRLWKGRDPTAVDQHRVPPDMIDVQMRAHHGVDRLARIAGKGEIAQKTGL